MCHSQVVCYTGCAMHGMPYNGYIIYSLSMNLMTIPQYVWHVYNTTCVGLFNIDYPMEIRRHSHHVPVKIVRMTSLGYTGIPHIWTSQYNNVLSKKTHCIS